MRKKLKQVLSFHITYAHWHTALLNFTPIEESKAMLSTSHTVNSMTVDGLVTQGNSIHVDGVCRQYYGISTRRIDINFMVTLIALDQLVMNLTWIR